MTTAIVALGEMPNEHERAEAGRLAVSIVEPVRRRPTGAADLHSLVSTMTLREYAHTLGALGALVQVFADQLDELAVASGLPWQSGDIMPRAHNALTATVSYGTSGMTSVADWP